MPWQPISTAPKDRTPVLLKVKQHYREGDENLAGICFVGKHLGLAAFDGFDIGWNFAAPVGYGGIPDEWLEGWMPLPE